jgi:hypothetical protein
MMLISKIYKYHGEMYSNAWNFSVTVTTSIPIYHEMPNKHFSGFHVVISITYLTGQTDADCYVIRIIWQIN